MKNFIKYSAIALTMAASFSSLANNHKPELGYYLYAGLSGNDIKLKHAYANGMNKSIGIGTKVDDFSMQMGFSHLSTSYSEINISAMYDFYKKENISVYAKLDYGLGTLDISSYKNSNDLSRYSAGIGVKYKYSENISILGEVIAHSFTDDTSGGESFYGSLCNDGTYSESTGRGTCSHHGGVYSSGYYSNDVDLAGDGSGTEFGVSIRYSF